MAVALDLGVWALAVMSAAALRLEFDLGQIGFRSLALLALVTGIAQIALGTGLSAYSPRYSAGTFENTLRVASATTAAGGVAFTVNALAYPHPAPLSVPLGATPIALALAVTGRVAARGYRERSARQARAGVRRVIVFGAGGDGRHLIRSMIDDPVTGCIPVAVLDDDLSRSGQRVAGVAVRGTRHDLWTVSRVVDADLLMITGRASASAEVHDLRALADDAGVAVTVVPPLGELVRHRPGSSLDDIPGQPRSSADSPAVTVMSDRQPGLGKRAFDVVFSLAALTIAAPVMAVIAVVLRTSGHGEVLYRAPRIGRDMRPFTMFKFSGMVPGDDGPRVTAGADPRITTTGRWLRATKLDELPQLFNVLRGDMSVVGPRPEDPRFVLHYTSDQQRVLAVRPGMTGLAFLRFGHEQMFIDRAKPSDVEAFYVDELLPRKLRVELDYVSSWSLAGDLRIIARTLVGIMR